MLLYKLSKLVLSPLKCCTLATGKTLTTTNRWPAIFRNLFLRRKLIFTICLRASSNDHVPLSSIVMPIILLNSGASLAAQIGQLCEMCYSLAFLSISQPDIDWPT